MKKALFLIFIVVSCLRANAQIMFKTEYFGKSSYHLSEGDEDSKIGDSKGSAIVYSGGVNIPLSMKMNENNRPTAWSLSIGGAYAKLDNKNFTEPLVVDEIFNMGLNLNYLTPISRKWSMMASFGGGVYMPTTRFSEIRFKNLLANAGTIFICHIRPNLDLGGGAALNNSFGYPMIFPALYLDWKLEGSYNLKISMLSGLEISAGRNLTKNFSLNILGEMNGQMAIIEQDGKDKIFTHQYFVAGLHPELKLGKKTSINATIGVNAMRPAQIQERKLKNLFQDRSYYFRASPYASLGMVVGF